MPATIDLEELVAQVQETHGCHLGDGVIDIGLIGRAGHGIVTVPKVRTLSSQSQKNENHERVEPKHWGNTEAIVQCYDGRQSDGSKAGQLKEQHCVESRWMLPSILPRAAVYLIYSYYIALYFSLSSGRSLRGAGWVECIYAGDVCGVCNIFDHFNNEGRESRVYACLV